MSTVTAPTPPRQRRPKPQRFFSILFRIGPDRYNVVPIRNVAPEVAVKAYRFLKLDSAKDVIVARYDVRQLPEGGASCECKGFLRWNHCKHCETLAAANMIDLPQQEGGGR
jgi:hypothetical protein